MLWTDFEICWTFSALFLCVFQRRTLHDTVAAPNLRSVLAHVFDAGNPHGHGICNFGIFHWPNQVNNYFVPAVFLMYSLAGFFWARRFFLSAQDVQWTGGVIAFSSRKRNSERTQVLGRPRNWFFALVRKELQLQQVNILIAAVVLILHLASVTVRRIHPDFDNPNIGLLLEFIWMLWLAMPLLIGSAAVAEERRVGVTESQFCLPVSRRAQFAIKFFVALILSLVLGGLTPFTIERAHDLNYYIFVVAAVIFFVSFYASTLARTTFQASVLPWCCFLSFTCI